MSTVNAKNRSGGKPSGIFHFPFEISHLSLLLQSPAEIKFANDKFQMKNGKWQMPPGLPPLIRWHSIRK